MVQISTDWPTLQSTDFLTIRTAVMLLLPLAVSRSATALDSSVITCRPLNEGQAFRYSSYRIAEWRRSELSTCIHTLQNTATVFDRLTLYSADIAILDKELSFFFNFL